MNAVGPKPTYLNYRANLRSSSASTPSTVSAPAAIPAGSSIILYVSSAASPHLSTHLSVLLSTHRVAAVHLLGPKDAVLKQLRTEVYTAAGRQRQDVAVNLALTDGSQALEKAVKEIGARGQKVLGALVCEWEHETQAAEQDDVLSIDSQAFEAVWRSSVLPLHILLRNLLPLFSTSSSTTSSTPNTQPFLYLDTSAQPPFAAASRAALLSSISSSPLAQNITIGQASEHLKPATTAAETQSMRSLRIDTNGNGTNGLALGQTTPEQSPLFGAESPTKLWASWAAQYE